MFTRFLTQAYLSKHAPLRAAALLAATAGILYSCRTSPAQPAATTNSAPAAAAVTLPEPKPEENRFTKTILVNDLNEPMELAVARDGRVFWVERAGKFFMYDPQSRRTRLLHHFPIPEKALTVSIDGLLGLTLDPGFSQNRLAYFFYTVQEQGHYRQRVSRFRLREDFTLDPSSEQVLLHFPIFVLGRTHTGGSLAWDQQGNLYIATGDDVIPSQSNGFAPLDERPGRAHFDAQGTSGNTNDLRGKILRIHPEPNGSYTIPQGNLFPPGTPNARPEIYVMGTRNPFRISVDPVTSFLYWGEVGPDAGTDGELGPRGYDEFNQARQAGNFGWPFFVADNQPYRDYDFQTKTAGDLFQVQAPQNHSVNNTGLKVLPPAQPAMIWYPYDESPAFPGMGIGGRCAMSGPVYHYDPALASGRKLPAYYDGAWFIYDWMRNWIFAVRLDQHQRFVRMEPFMPQGNFLRPMDLELGPDGALYLLEYGSVYNADNEDARLVRIDFNPGNRAPVARISLSDTLGTAPLQVSFKSQSFDHDAQDRLTYEWSFEGGAVGAREAQAVHTFKKNGIYPVVLRVTDQGGKSAVDTVRVMVGNTLPQVTISTSGSPTFYFPDQVSLAYSVKVQDKEDQVVDTKKIKVQLNYLARVEANQALANPEAAAEGFSPGKTLLENSDCKACHQLSKKAIGPAFLEVSKRYREDPSATARLADKVISGGSGAWGLDAMNAHPQLSKEEATEIVKYVLSLAASQDRVSLPASGKAPLQQHGKTGGGRYLLTAAYTDRGSNVQPLTGRATLLLRPAKQEAEAADVAYHVSKKGIWAELSNKQAYFALKDIDLKNIRQLRYRYAAQQTAALEVRVDSLRGPVIGTLPLPATGSAAKYAELSAPLQDPGGRHTLYFVPANPDTVPEPVCRLDWLEFMR